jgi:transposase
LNLHGIRVEKIGPGFKDFLDEVRLWNGSKLPPQLKDRLVREYERYVLVREQILTLERQRRAAIQELKDPRMDQVRHLVRLKGIGENGAWLLVMELFGWREFRNRRQVGSIAGLTPTPWASGDEDNEQGIDKAGNRRVRAMMIELAWCWLRYQPRSELALWFERRFGSGGKRARRIGIVALARRLLVALWRYLVDGVVPKGAVLMTPR